MTDHYVYQMVDFNQPDILQAELLYIGYTTDLNRRAKEHRANGKSFWHLLVPEENVFQNKRTALAFESLYIYHYRPVLNTTFKHPLTHISAILAMSKKDKALYSKLAKDLMDWDLETILNGNV